MSSIVKLSSLSAFSDKFFMSKNETNEIFNTDIDVASAVHSYNKNNLINFSEFHTYNFEKVHCINI